MLEAGKYALYQSCNLGAGLPSLAPFFYFAGGVRASRARRNSSITLLTSSLASFNDRITICRSIAGSPGCRLLRQYAVLSHHGQCVGQRIQRHRQPSARGAHLQFVQLKFPALAIEYAQAISFGAQPPRGQPRD